MCDNKYYDKDEITLILSALEWDRVGTYGDGREERINALVAKIKRLEVLTKRKEGVIESV
jgi:hypothetical protein